MPRHVDSMTSRFVISPLSGGVRLSAGWRLPVENCGRLPRGCNASAEPGSELKAGSTLLWPLEWGPKLPVIDDGAITVRYAAAIFGIAHRRIAGSHRGGPPRVVSAGRHATMGGGISDLESLPLFAELIPVPAELIMGRCHGAVNFRLRQTRPERLYECR